MADSGWRARLLDERVLFVAVSVATNLLMLGRSYIAMLTLDERGLGTVTLVQTLILFVSTLQLGMLQGGYRLLCNGDSEDRMGINNLLYACLAGLTGLVAIGSIVALVAIPGRASVLLAICGAAAGVLTLNRTWISNQLIAQGTLSRLTRLTLWTALLALLPLLAAPVEPLGAMIASIVAQPLLFVVLALAKGRELRPTALRFNKPLALRILAAGFALFLTGIFLQANILAERWYVTANLGLEALGRLFLATLYITLFQLVPTSLDSIFLPRLVTVYRAGDTQAVSRVCRTFFLVMAGYCLLAVAITLLLAEPVLQWLLPARQADLRYVWLVLPGLVIFTLSGPFAIMFNALIAYRAYYAAYGAGTLATTAVLLGAALGGSRLELDGVMLLKSAIYGLMAVVLLAGWAWLSRDNRQFRFSLFRYR